MLQIRARLELICSVVDKIEWLIIDTYATLRVSTSDYNNNGVGLHANIHIKFISGLWRIEY